MAEGVEHGPLAQFFGGTNIQLRSRVAPVR
jgi:hypothetical protein